MKHKFGEWIKEADDSPAHGEMVLTCYHDADQGWQMDIRQCVHVFDKDGVSAWWISARPLPFPAHWMPLPQEPKDV